MNYKPHAYQEYCIRRILSDKAVGLFLDMGLGKTVITLTAINDLKYNRFEINRVLVIAPKKVAEDTWTREAQKWEHTKHLRVVSLLGSQNRRIRALNSPGDIYVINRENVVWLVDYMRNNWCFDMVIIDELSSFKNPASKRFKAFKQIRPRIGRVIGLTGTPAPKGLPDLWAQVYCLDQGERLEKYITHFRERYTYHLRDKHMYVPKPGALETVQRKISDLCISLKAEDYLTLPPLIETTHHVHLDTKATALYRQLERDLVLDVDEETITAVNAASLHGKLLQLCNGAIYTADKEAVVNVHDCKVEAFMELVEKLNGQPALVFYNFQHDLERLTKALKNTKLVVGALKSPADIKRWNEGKIDILLAHPASAAYGLNLQDGGRHVIWFGLNYSLELNQQANARLYRQGQTKPVYIHRLVTVGGVDEDVITRLEDRTMEQDAIIEMLKARISKVKRGG